MGELKIGLSENISGFFGVKFIPKLNKWEVQFQDHKTCQYVREYFDCLVEAGLYKDDNTISARGNVYRPNDLSGAFKRHKKRIAKFNGDTKNPVELFNYLNDFSSYLEI